MFTNSVTGRAYVKAKAPVRVNIVISFGAVCALAELWCLAMNRLAGCGYARFTWFHPVQSY